MIDRAFYSSLMIAFVTLSRLSTVSWYFAQVLPCIGNVPCINRFSKQQPFSLIGSAKLLQDAKLIPKYGWMSWSTYFGPSVAR